MTVSNMSEPTPPTVTSRPEPSCLQMSPDAMTGKPSQRRVTIANPQGFHLRPLRAFAELAARFQCNVTVHKEERRANGKSPWELMALFAPQGTELIIEAEGADAEAALDALVELVANSITDDDSEPPPPKG